MKKRAKCIQYPNHGAFGPGGIFKIVLHNVYSDGTQKYVLRDGDDNKRSFTGDLFDKYFVTI